MKKMIFGVYFLCVWASVANAVCLESIVPSTPTSQFIINPDGTAFDTVTGLIWKRCRENGPINDNGTPLNFSDDTCPGLLALTPWQNALQIVADVNSGGGFAGYTDWRLPNVKELESIRERACGLERFNRIVFPLPNITSTVYNYYSSTSYKLISTTAWGDFARGLKKNGLDVLNKRIGYTRLVRGGQ